jgi:GNAT superfamily N-acetyltransferase
MPNPRYSIIEGSLDWADRYREFTRQSYLAAYVRPELGVTEDLFSEEIFDSARIIKYFRDLCENTNDNKTWLAIDDDSELVGVVGAHKYEDFCEMKAFYVRPELQGQGVGRALYEKVLQFAGGMAMQLDVVNFMDKTISMYERWGFTVDTSREAFEYPWEEWPPGPAHIMRAIYMIKPPQGAISD